MVVNSMYFSKEAMENGELQKLLDYLMQYSYSENDSDDMKKYCDIHIKPADCEAFIVEWSQEPWSNKFGDRGGFEYVDCDSYIMKEYSFPDGSIEYFPDDEEFQYALDAWLSLNPGWHKHDIMNIWVNDNDIEGKEK